MVTDQEKNGHAEKVRIAAFDFDGTSITGNSPVLLVRYLKKRGMLGRRTLGKILLWAAAYKLRLPQEEAWVRGLVFTAFEGLRKTAVDDFLMDFYDECIEGQGRFRAAADERMRRYREEGVEVCIVSATFEPIVRRAAELHPIDVQLSTNMAVDSHGCYTTEVDGECIEGTEKVRALRSYADARYGKGNWVLVDAYGDHHSDAPMLEAAVNGFAVNPDSPLKRRARKEGWTILDWADDRRS